MTYPDNRSSQPDWIATLATITSCRYQFARLNTLNLGVSTTRRFRLTFDYYAHGRLYSGDFQSDVAIAQDQELPIQYDPLHPEQNSLAANDRSGLSARGSLMAFGVAGSVVLSLLWLAFVRGCG